LCFAQSNYQDVVYLKNGGIIRGIIIEQIPNESIKIETADGNVFVFQMDNVAVLSKVLIKEQAKEQPETDSKNWGLKDGYRGVLDVGYQIAIGDFGIDRLKIDFINGYQAGPYVSAGLGTGVRYYFDAEALLIPVFVNMKANFIDARATPYLAVSVGYSFDATNDFKGVGLLFNPTVGISFIFNNYSLNIGLGYELQKMDFFFYSFGTGNIYDIGSQNSGTLSLSIGMSF